MTTIDVTVWPDV